MGELCNFLKSTLSHSMTYNSDNQHCMATGEVSKCAEENLAFHELMLFSHNTSGFDISDNM